MGITAPVLFLLFQVTFLHPTFTCFDHHTMPTFKPCQASYRGNLCHARGAHLGATNA
jgi:hypothetical protein